MCSVRVREPTAALLPICSLCFQSQNAVLHPQPTITYEASYILHCLRELRLAQGLDCQLICAKAPYAHCRSL